MKTLVSLVTLWTICNCGVPEHPIVDTAYGIVKGLQEKSRSGRTYYAFKGIPYAKPPIGNLRFKAPEEPNKWNDIFDAQNYSPPCMQKNYLFQNPNVEGSEDCLYINIYSPKLRPKTNNNKLLPVMVFINWGGFFAGYSSSDYLGPEYFMDKDVVLVTFNYRIGVLGFFSTSDDASPGNYGLKDQVAALKWVQNNIHYFGGNKDKVTLFGQSAGAASVHYHMFSKESKNLFHQGISMSGTALALWAYSQPKTQLSLARIQSQMFGCRSKNSFKMVECLRNVDAKKLIESGDNFKYFSVDPLNVYTPSVERYSEKNANPFITKSPVDYIRSKDFAKVPWIVGVVDDEGLIRAEPLLRQSRTRDLLITSFDKIMPNLLALFLSSPQHQIPKLWNKIKNFYFESKKGINISDVETIESFVNLYTDRSFTYTSYQTALFHQLNGHDNIWFYKFNYSGQYSYGNVFSATDENFDYNWGVSHCDDLIYLFKTPALFPEISNFNDVFTSKLMIRLWTNFATYGNPTPTQLGTLSDEWTTLENKLNTNFTKDLSFLSIEGHYRQDDPSKPTMRTGIYNERIKFWEEMPLMENIKELNQTHVDL